MTIANPTLAEAINHPAHYNRGRIEVIDFIEDQHLDFHLGNCVKYIARAPHKGEELRDLRKALWYLERAVALREHASMPRPGRAWVCSG